MSKIRRKVTVENSKTISDSSSNTTTSSTSNPAAPSRRPSVFERLGPSTGSNAADSHCRNWLKTGNCSYGNTCRYTHGTQPRGKVFNFSRSAERPTGDLRERMKNKRQDVDPENLKRDVEEPASPTARRDSSRGRRREKEDIKITKERTPASEEEPTEWETNREDSDIGDYDYELSLEMKRQKIQRELMKLEQENLEKREDIVVKKDDTPIKTRVTAMPKASPEQLTIKNSPSPRKSSRSPKHKSGTKGLGSGKKEKKGSVSSPASEATKASKGGHSKKKGPRTPSPPPPVPLDIPVVGKKHKNKHKNKEKSEEKQKDGKDRGRDTEKHKEKKEKRRDRSDSSNKAKRALTSEEHSGSVSSPSRTTSPLPRKKSSSPKASHKAPALSSPPNSSPSPPRHHRSPTPPRRRSTSSQSGSSAQRHSSSPRRRRSSSPTYHRSVAGSASSPLSSRRSRSPLTSHEASSPHRRSDRSSPSHRHSRGRERFRGERERSLPAQERRHERRDEARNKREKESIRDDRDYDSELLSSRDTRSDRDTRESRDRRDARERGRETTRDSRDNRDAKDLRTDTRSSRESLGSRERDRDREKDREREKERERDRSDTQRKEEATQEDRNYCRGHGREDTKTDRAEKNGRVRSRANESSDKGSIRNSRGSQVESSHDVWESRSSAARERSVERSNDRSTSERGSDRDRYESDRRGEPSRDSSYDRRGGHGERDRRDRASPSRYQGRSEDSEREERREDRRTDRAEERREDRTRERERERDREREKEKERDREREREKEREAERERARERERERDREREREREEREREREERERDREERERERREREREREQRERDRQREWEERERGREDRRDRREDERSIRDSRDDRKMSRKRTRVESSPSPRTTPKRAARDLSPADSDGYNSGEDKSSDKHRLLSQVVRPQEPLLRTPPRSTSSDDKSGHWKDEERRGTLDKRDTRHLDVLEPRGERSRGDRRGELPVESHSDSRSRGRDSTPLSASLALATGSDDRDTASSQSHEEVKKKTKSQRKGLKKGRKEDESGANANSGDRFNPEPPAVSSTDGLQPLYSPRKGAKKKALERKRKRSRGADSDMSDEDSSSAQQPQGKRKRGPRTPPPSMRPDRRGNAEPSPLSKMDNFSDWSDEEVTERGGAPLEAPAAPAERTPTEPFRRGGARVGRDRERCNPAGIAPLIPQDPPMLLQTLTPQPLMSQPLLRKPPLEQTRSSSMGSNQSRASSKRLRSPSNESAHRDDPQGPRSRRGRLQGANCRDRERERERERERDRERERQVNDAPGAERKSRIDQLRRGEPSRSTSSDRQDSRSHSSRRSSPDSERQARSRAGSYDSRERERDREPFDRERERKDHRPQQPQQQPLLLQQPLQQQRDWEPEPRDWPSRGREPLLMRPGREPLLRERDMRDRERLIPEGLIQQHERDRDGRGDRGSDRERDRMIMDLPPHTDSRAPGRGDLRAEMRGDLRGDMMRQDRGEYEPLLPREAFSPEEQEKPSNSLHVTEDQRELEKTDSIDGDDDRKDNDGESVASVGEEYEPISDDELDEILADSQKKEDQQDEEKITGPLDVIDVDWSSLMPKHKQEPRAAGAALLRFTPGAVLLRAGISKRLAGPELLEQVREVCKRELEDPKDADKLFDQDLGALNRRMERTSLLSNLGPYCKALCARRDFAIRRQLLKNDKGLTKQYPTTPVVDNELLQMSVRLFRRTMAAQTSGVEKPDVSAPTADVAGPAATAANELTAQPEVCVS